MIDKQREELEDELSIVKSKLKILELKENFYKNKAENLIKQKNFLVVQITNILESMNIEYNRIHDLESQKDFMISVKKSNKNIQEVYFKGINDMRYFKQIIEFMNFNEFETANDILKVQEDQELNESEMPLSSNSNNTSFVSEIKEESFGDSRQDTVLNKRPNVIPVKKSETSIVNKIEIGKMKERKQTSTNVLYKDITLSKGGKTEKAMAQTTDEAKFQKDSEFYFTYYCQEVLNAVLMIAMSFYEGTDLDIPESLYKLEFLVRERSDSDLATEILNLFEGKTRIESTLKDNKENLDKLERQKANLLKELNDTRKKVSKLKRDEGEGSKSDEATDSISGDSPEVDTPRSEDLATIELLKKQKKGLEVKLKDNKRKNNEEKHDFNEKINSFETELEEKNSKLQSLKDSLVGRFKDDIEKLRKSFESKQHNLEAKLLSEKHKDIEILTKKIKNEYKKKIGDLEESLCEAQNSLKDIKSNSELKNKRLNVQIKHENENKLKILRENKGTFTMAFDNYSPIMAQEHLEEQLLLYLCKSLEVNKSVLRLISVNVDERLENDHETSLSVYLYEIVDDLKQTVVSTVLNKLRVQIRDASSILFDLGPVYVAINVGSVHGFVYEKPIDDYYLLKRQGIYFGERQLLVTLLKHPNHYYKVVGYDVTTNQEFSLSLDTHDVIELINAARTPEEMKNQKLALHDVLDGENEVSEIILSALTLVKKEVLTFMLCQQRLYLEDFVDTKNSISQKLIEDEENKQAISQSSVVYSEDIESDKINSEHSLQNKAQNYSQGEQCTQTNFKDNILFEKYDCVLTDGPKSYTFGVYDALVSVTRGHHSERLMVDFKFKLNKDNEKHFSISWILFTLKDFESNSIEAFTKCVNLGDEDTIIVSVEKFMDPEGIHIKMHDFYKQVSLTIFYKLNGSQFNEIPIKDFEPTPNEMRFEMMELMSTKNTVLYVDDLIMVPKLNKKHDEKSMISMSDDDRTMHSYNSNNNIFNVDKIFSIKSKGTLVLREICIVRYIFNLNETIDDQPQKDYGKVNVLSLNENSEPIIGRNKMQKEVSCIISFFRDSDNFDLINVEVFLRNLKISITSQVSVIDIFGSHSIRFEQKVSILTQLMHKMFIFYEQGNYTLRIENKAVPILEYLDQRNLKTKSPISQVESIKLSEESNKKRERLMATLEITEDWQEEFEKLEKYHVINDYIFKVTVYFLDEPEQEPEILKPSVNKQAPNSMISNQSVINRKINLSTSQIGGDPDTFSAYLEVRSTTLGISYKKLLLMEDLREYMFGNVQSIFSDGDASSKKSKVFDIICDNLRLQNNKVYVTNEVSSKPDDFESKISYFQRDMNKQHLLEGLQLQGVGGGLFTKAQLDNFSYLASKNNIEKQLILNQEFMFSEHLHDIKVYKYSLSAEGENSDKSNIYILETFEVGSKSLAGSLPVNDDDNQSSEIIYS